MEGMEGMAPGRPEDNESWTRELKDSEKDALRKAIEKADSMGMAGEDMTVPEEEMLGEVEDRMHERGDDLPNLADIIEVLEDRKIDESWQVVLLEEQLKKVQEEIERAKLGAGHSLYSGEYIHNLVRAGKEILKRMSAPGQVRDRVAKQIHMLDKESEWLDHTGGALGNN